MTEVRFNWKQSLINKLQTPEAIINDCMQDVGESFLFEFAKDDVAKILRCDANYKFIVEKDLHLELYHFAVKATQNQLQRVLDKKSNFVNCTMPNLQIINKIISRTVNNFKNLFDDRYRDSVKVFKTNLIDGVVDLDDALSIIIKEEEAKLENAKNQLVVAVGLRQKARSIKYAAHKLAKELIKKAEEIENDFAIDLKSDEESSIQKFSNQIMFTSMGVS